MDGARTGAAPMGAPDRKVAAGRMAVRTVEVGPRAVMVLRIVEAPPAAVALRIVMGPAAATVRRTVMALAEALRRMMATDPHAAGGAWIPTLCSAPRASRRATPG